MNNLWYTHTHTHIHIPQRPFSLFHSIQVSAGCSTEVKWKISFVSQRVFPLLSLAYFNIWASQPAPVEKALKAPLKGTLNVVSSTSCWSCVCVCVCAPCAVWNVLDISRCNPQFMEMRPHRRLWESTFGRSSWPVVHWYFHDKFVVPQKRHRDASVTNKGINSLETNRSVFSRILVFRSHIGIFPFVMQKVTEHAMRSSTRSIERILLLW